VALRNTLLVVAASAASGAVGYQAATALQSSPSAQEASAQTADDTSKTAAATDPSAPASGDGADPAKEPEPPETLVMNLQPAGFVQEGSRVSLTFSIDKNVKGGDAVEGVTAQDIIIEEDGEVASPDEGWRRFTADFRDVRVNHRLLLDLSGSMATEARLNALARAGARYVDKILATKDGANHFIAVDGFDGGPVVSLQRYTQDAQALKQALANPCGTTLCNDPSTNLNGALEAEIAALEAEAATTSGVSERAIVLFTDGIDQAGAATFKATLAKSAASGVHVYTITVGADGDQEHAGAFGKAGNFPAADPKALTKAAENVADRTPALAKHFYRVDYCTPKRGGTHRKWQRHAILADSATFCQCGGRACRGAYGTFDGCMTRCCNAGSAWAPLIRFRAKSATSLPSR